MQRAREFAAHNQAWMREHGLAAIDPDPGSEAAWMDHVQEVADATLYPRANSWYVGANVPGKPRVFLMFIGGLDRYVERCDTIVSEGYTGFKFS